MSDYRDRTVDIPAPASGLSVTTVDHANGDHETKELIDYVLTVGPGHELAHITTHANGTTILTIKRRP